MFGANQTRLSLIEVLLIRIRATALVTLTLLGVGPGVSATAPALTREVLAMGTFLKIALAGGAAPQLQAASEAALREVDRIEAAISTWRPDSVFSRLNAAGGAPMALAPEWAALLTQAQGLSARTGGAFDPVLGALVAAWGLREGGRRPSPSELRAARRASGGALLEIREGVVRLAHPAAGLEEGAFGKGYALDRALAVLRSAGVEHGVLDFGGQVQAFGEPARVSLADPVHRDRARLAVVLRDASLSSSGTSERGRHILDPRSGRPCAAWGSVGVVAPTGLEADGLSTALYVLGPREGLRWAAAHGVAACFLLTDGRIRMSPAFRALDPKVLSPES